MSFMFATGIENSYPTIPGPQGGKIRRDEMESCGHYRRWREDFQLVKDLGIQYLRYGPPYYRVHVGPGRYDWAFADETFAEMRRLEIHPIVDLCHFGVPDWLGDFQNEQWPEHFAEYALAFAKRFPWVRRYTPVNEIFIAAKFSALNGWWNECRTDDRSFVRAMHNLCRANVLGMRAILTVRPDAIFIQSESSEYFHASDPSCQRIADIHNERRFLSLDFTYGHQVSVPMYEYLLDNGMTRQQYHWFEHHHVKASCIMGNDYYATNEHEVTCGPGHHEVKPSGEIFGYYVITKQYYDRYHLPVMHTETNHADPEAVSWLRKEWENMYRLKMDGVPIVGFTWYSLTDQIDWDIALREDRGTVNPYGLYDLERRLRPVGAAYRDLIHRWRSVLPTESHNLQLANS